MRNMENIMSVGPVSGNKIAVNLTPGKVVQFTVTAQAALNQYVELTNSSGGLVFQAKGSGGTNGTPNLLKAGSFTVDSQGNYTIYIGTNGGGASGGSWSSVLWDDN